MFLNFGLYFRMPNGIAGDVDRFLTGAFRTKPIEEPSAFSDSRTSR